MITWDRVLLPEPLGPMMACTSPERTVRSIPLRISLPATPARSPRTSSTCSELRRSFDHHLHLAVDDARLVHRDRPGGGQRRGLAGLEEKALPCFQHSRVHSSASTSPSESEMSWWLQRSPMA